MRVRRPAVNLRNTLIRSSSAGGAATITSDSEQIPPGPREPVAAASPLKRIMSSTPAYMTTALVVLIVGFSLDRPDAFPTLANAQNELQAASELLILGAGMTYVMVAGGIDLSIGSILVFANVLSAQVMQDMGDGGGLTILVGILVSLGAGALWGLFNGLVITKAKVPAIITTLGTFGAAQGLALVVSGGNDIRTVPAGLTSFGGGSTLSFVPYTALVALAVVIIAEWWLWATRYGRHTYLIGSNLEGARRAGIRVDNHVLSLYVISGLSAGVASVLSLATYSTTTIDGHTLDNLTVITAVILGGTSLFGGIGTVFGTVIGVFIPTILQNGLIIVGVASFWQQVVIGFVLIIAVYIDQLKRRSRQRA